MNNYKKKLAAFSLFEEGNLVEEVMETLQVSEEQATEWLNEYELDSDMDLSEKQIGALARLASIKERELETYREEKKKELEKVKRGKVASFKKLFSFFLTRGHGFEWSRADLANFTKRLRALQTSIEEISNYDDHVFQQLFIWVSVNEFINDMENRISSIEEGSDSLGIHLDESEITFLENALEIEDFDDEVVEEEEEATELAGILEDEIKPVKIGSEED